MRSLVTREGGQYEYVGSDSNDNFDICNCDDNSFRFDNKAPQMMMMNILFEVIIVTEIKIMIMEIFIEMPRGSDNTGHDTRNNNIDKDNKGNGVMDSAYFNTRK